MLPSANLITKRDKRALTWSLLFFVRVKPSVEGIATRHAQTLGQRTLSPEDLRMLVEDKFVDALRATAAQMTIPQATGYAVKTSFRRAKHRCGRFVENGTELEGVSLTSAANVKSIQSNNAFDAEGLTKLTRKPNAAVVNVMKWNRMWKWRCAKRTATRLSAS